jgi:hypothetical protein
MKVAGYVHVAVPECEAETCNSRCKLVDDCDLQVVIDWGDDVLTLPGPTCPAFDSVPNPWPEEYPDRPWNEETEEQMLDAQLLRLKAKK